MVQARKRKKHKLVIGNLKYTKILGNLTWLFAGIFLGCSLMYFFHSTPDSVHPKKEPAVVKSDKIAEINSIEPVFDFYTRLTEKKVGIIPQIKDKGTRKSALTKSVATPESTNNAYLLQAGAFRNHADADALRARLLLLGFTANIQMLAGENKEPWYRVQLGPFFSTKQLFTTRAALMQHHISPLILKLKS